MNKLFTFGCSFTYGNGCLVGEVYPKSYYKNEDDLIWPEIVAKEIGYKLYNCGMGAISNDVILDNMMETFDMISEGDIVIIQKTFTHRFDIAPTRKNNHPYIRKFLTITPSSNEALKYEGYKASEIEHILYNTWLMDNELNDMRVDNRFNFFKKLFLLKGVKKCICWDVINYIDKNVYERIQEHSNGEIIDAHWSYNGHREFSKVILNKLYQEPLKMAFKAKLI
jgi:hypothetical protein